MRPIEMEEIIPEIQYKDWMLKIARDGESNRMYLQYKFYAQNAYTGASELQSCRKWFLSEHMTKSEIVGTAFKAVLSAEEHECRETFKYKGQAIFGPHINVDHLVAVHELEKDNILDSRTIKTE